MIMKNFIIKFIIKKFRLIFATRKQSKIKNKFYLKFYLNLKLFHELIIKMKIFELINFAIFDII